jgi:MFS family permease
MFVIGTTVFVLASLLAAVSGSGAALLGARVLQGVGGAMILPTTLSLLNANFRGRERALAFAVWGATIGGTAAFGPLLGGWLTTSFTWRWGFGINLPIGLLVLIGTFLLIPEPREGSARRGIDVVGAVLSIVGL